MRNGDARIILSKIAIGLQEGAGKVYNLTDQAGAVEEEGERVEDEDCGPSLFGSCEQQQNDEQDDRGAELSAVVYANANSVLEEDIKVIHVDCERGAIGIVHGHVLGNGIEIGRHGLTWRALLV